MASRRSLLLFLVAVTAVGAFFMLELPRRRGEERERTNAARLFTFDPRTIDAIVLERAGLELRFALAGTHWTVVAPVIDDAETAAVAPIVSTLAGAEIIRDLGRSGGDARYGLTPPAIVVTLLAAGDTAAVLELGDFTVDHSALYARRSDGHVLLVPTSLHRATALPLDDYRNRRVVVFDLSTVRAFEIDSRDGGRMFWRRGNGESWFTVSAGDTVRGDSVAVPAVLRRLRGMRVRSFVTGTDTSSMPPLCTVTIHRDDGSSRSVHFIAVSDSVYHARADGNLRTVEVADDPSDIARESVATLRDRRVVQFDPGPARRITFSSADTTAVLVRAGDAWALPNPALGAIDPERAADFVRALRALRFSRLPEHAAFDPRDHPRFSLVVFADGDRILDELHCAPAPGPGNVWFAHSRSLGAVCEIDRGALDAIAARLARLRR